MTDSDELITSPDVGRLLGVSSKTVHRRVEAGELPAAQKLPGPNGAYLFRRTDVERYVAQQRAKADEPALAAEGDHLRLPQPRQPPDRDAAAGSCVGAA